MLRKKQPSLFTYTIDSPQLLLPLTKAIAEVCCEGDISKQFPADTITSDQHRQIEAYLLKFRISCPTKQKIEAKLKQLFEKYPLIEDAIKCYQARLEIIDKSSAALEILTPAELQSGTIFFEELAGNPLKDVFSTEALEQLERHLGIDPSLPSSNVVDLIPQAASSNLSSHEKNQDLTKRLELLEDEWIGAAEDDWIDQDDDGFDTVITEAGAIEIPKRTRLEKESQDVLDTEEREEISSTEHQLRTTPPLEAEPTLFRKASEVMEGMRQEIKQTLISEE